MPTTLEDATVDQLTRQRPDQITVSFVRAAYLGEMRDDHGRGGCVG